MVVVVVVIMEGRYIKYYLSQGGKGIGDIGVLHRSPLIYQRGRGIGTLFDTVLRVLNPLFYSGFNALKDQAVKTGSAVLRDIGQKPIKSVLKEQGALALQELAERGVNKLKRKMQGGEGIKRKRRRANKQLSKQLKRSSTRVQRGGRKKKRRAVKRKQKKTPKRKRSLDIFD